MFSSLQANTYGEFKGCALELDDLEGNNVWKLKSESEHYDAAMVEYRLKQLEDARISCDVGRMLFLIRTALSRELGDMHNLKLYKHSHIGTKALIDRYIDTALNTLDTLLDVSGRSRYRSDGPETKYILEQLLSARQAFGRSALLLSGGATFGMNHCGVLKALWENRLLPRIISGASAGSIVCAVLCTRTDDELPEVLATFCHGDMAVFEDEAEGDGILRKIARFLKTGALFDISHLTRVMRDWLGDLTFQEAYNRTRRILNICVSSASLYELPRLLNYVTAPNVLIWSAVAASCSVPLIFTAASLCAKDPRTGEAIPWNPSPQRWIDGSVDNDLPMTRLSELFNVNHFIVSQVNPHVVPFLVKEEEFVREEALKQEANQQSRPGFLNTITNLARDEALHRMHVIAELGIFPNTLTKTRSVLSQKYSGDINIFPEINYADFPRILKNPTVEFMQDRMICGERATWPKMSRIRNHLAIELALDNAVHAVRSRVAFSPSATDLRSKFSSTPSPPTKRSRSRSRLSRLRSARRGVRHVSGDLVNHAAKAEPNSMPSQAHLTRRVVGTRSARPAWTSGIDGANDLQTSQVESSGADTSLTEFSLDSGDEDSDSISSQSPPSPESHYPWRVPLITRSQPSTPSAQGMALYPPASPNSMLGPFALKETTKTSEKHGVQSSPELRYRRLYHSGYSDAKLESSKTSQKASPRLPDLTLDISGTRSLMMRRKLSSSSMARMAEDAP